MNCVIWLLLLALGLFVMLSVIRWFEQVTEAVELGWWNKVSLLVLIPFAVWLYPSRVAAGRPTAVPLHEPVRGFGTVPKSPSPEPVAPVLPAESEIPEAQQAQQPPAGTPPEFVENPGAAAKSPPRPKSQVDPEKLAKLRQQMRDQGMLDE